MLGVGHWCCMAEERPAGHRSRERRITSEHDRSSPATLLVVRVERPAHDVDAVVRFSLVGYRERQFEALLGTLSRASDPLMLSDLSWQSNLLLFFT
jgi:hypothetical protein